jgi:hypothetical protein
MRERGDFVAFTGTDGGATTATASVATATVSVAACICRGLRRQYAITASHLRLIVEPALLITTLP